MHTDYFEDLYTSHKMREIFSDNNRITSWLQVEAALACVQAECRIIPEAAAKSISSAAKMKNINLEEMKAEYDRVGFPITPLVHQLAENCGKETARWIHWGATTQDIIDTGLVLQMRDGLKLIESEINAIITALTNLVINHRCTIMAGRTFQQQAAPITFGYKAAVWLDEMLRHKERISGLKKRALVCQYGGAVGNLSTLGESGVLVRRKLSEKLSLEEPAISWHTARDGWAELIHWMAMVSATLGKIASEIAILMRTEVDEAREPYQPGRGASSTMPQKRNPIAAPPIIAAAHRIRESVGSQLSAMMQEHERGVSSQPLEWMVIPETFLLLSGALKHSRSVLEKLDIDADHMYKNLHKGGGFLMAESVMMGLAKKIGRAEAHKLVSEVSQKSINAGIPFRDGLLADQRVMSIAAETEIDKFLDPAEYLGCTNEMIDMVLEHAEKVGKV